MKISVYHKKTFNGLWFFYFLISQSLDKNVFAYDSNYSAKAMILKDLMLACRSSMESTA